MICNVVVKLFGGEYGDEVVIFFVYWDVFGIG